MTDHKAREAPSGVPRSRKLLAICLGGPAVIGAGLGLYYAAVGQTDWGAAPVVGVLAACVLVVVCTFERKSVLASNLRAVTMCAGALACALVFEHSRRGRISLGIWIATAVVFAAVLVILAIVEIVRRRHAERQHGEPIAPDERLDRRSSDIHHDL